MAVGNSNLEFNSSSKCQFRVSAENGKSRHSKVSSESLFLRGVAIKPPIVNNHSSGAEDGRVVLYFTYELPSRAGMPLN